MVREYKDLNDYEVMYMVEENDEYAKELLIKKYEPLIKKYARRFVSLDIMCGLDFEDYVQEGYYAIFEAYRRYNSSRNCSFFTYADLSIRRRMKNLLTTQTTLRQKALNNSISLFMKQDNDSEMELIDSIPDMSIKLPEDEVIYGEYISVLRNEIYSLPIDKASALELYYNGFNCRDISILLGLNYRNVGRILSKIKNKVTHLIEK